MDVERRSSVFLSGLGYRALWSPTEVNMIAQDDPRHRQQRMLVQPRLTGRSVGERRDEIEELTASVIADALASGDEVEVVDALAGQIPARLTARLLGFPESYWPQLKSWSERLMRTDMRDRDGRIFTEFMAANMEFVGALGAVAADKHADPCDDLISTWVHATIDGEPLTPDHIVHEVGLFIAGGAETTRTAIGHGLRAFVDHPEQWEAIATDPSLVPGAVEEVLRWVTPLNNMFRRAIVDSEVGGQAIRAGDRIALLYPSANRDEEVFTDPFTFDIRRTPNPHVAFGFGTHLCIGTHVARATLAALFGQLSAQITDLRVVSEVEVEANIFARAVQSFTLGFSRR
jgi:cytochrome P450 family 142 subfamily A polypeptide 1